MKWEVYRKTKKESVMKQAHKELLLSRIEKTITTKSSSQESLLMRWSHYVRPIARVGGVLMLGVAVFLLTYVSDRFQTQDIDPGMVVVSPVINTVQANSLGRIITAQGSIRAQQGGEAFDIQDIVEGQFIILDAGARVVLAIDESVEATITGPARFSLEQYDENTTLLNLVEGSYAEVKNLLPEDKQEIEEKQEDEETERELIVKTPTLEVVTNTYNEIDVTIDATNTQEATIKNAGSSVIVKSLGTSQSLTVDTDHVAVWDLTDSVLALESTLVEDDSVQEEKLLAIRYEATDEQRAVLSDFLEQENQLEDITTPQDDEETNQVGLDDSVLLALVADDSQNNLQDESEEPQDTVSEDELLTVSGRVIEPERMERLKILLNASTLNHHVSQYQIFAEDPEKQQVVIQTLVGIMNRGLGEFNISGANTASKENLLSLTTRLLDAMQNEYFIPPSVSSPVRNVYIALGE